MRYWLLKTEPTSYSIDDLKRNKTTAWDGIRNYQARNTMRDDMKPGDLSFIYHSNSDPTGIYGVAEVISEGITDETQFDVNDSHFDPKSKAEAPTWVAVEVKFVRKYKTPISLGELREIAGLESMVVLQKGSRLSVQPVTKKEWETIEKKAMAG